MDLSNELTQNSLEIPAVVVPSGPKHERPVTAPNAVHEVAARLLAAYTVDGGQVHLAGCQFEERPFLRCQTERGDVFLTAEGSLAESTLVAELGLSTTRQLEEAPARLSAAQLRTMQAAARSLDGLTSTVPTVVWARHAAGALQFTFGIESVRLPFAGWAQTVDPAPCVCPLPGRETFHMAATDDAARSNKPLSSVPSRATPCASNTRPSAPCLVGPPCAKSLLNARRAVNKCAQPHWPRRLAPRAPTCGY